MTILTCFKAYDIRGKVPEELNDDLAYKIGEAFSEIIKPQKVIIGHDVRLESPDLANSLIAGLIDSGSAVIDIGLCGTEEVYFNSFYRQNQGIGGGIMVTASHNPKAYNGMKLVGLGGKPVSLDDDLKKIHDYIVYSNIGKAHAINTTPSLYTKQEDKSAYIDHLLMYVDIQKLKPLKIVVNPGNSAAGIIVKLLEKTLPFEFIYIQDEPNGNFPHGVPNPMLSENRKITSAAVIEHKADMGIAWDGDFDRCFFFDEKGNFIEGYYIVGLLAQSFLKKYPGEKIIHDPRLIWNTIDIAKQYNGTAIQSKSGHSFIKDKMRQENAIYGGEMSAHHYFRDFGYCDSGMIPWLLVAELMSIANCSLSSMVEQRINKFPCSGEINYKVEDADKAIEMVKNHFLPQNPTLDNIDGLSMQFTNWRLNLRKSNTEPLIRLNIETNGQKDSVQDIANKVEFIINHH